MIIQDDLQRSIEYLYIIIEEEEIEEVVNSRQELTLAYIVTKHLKSTEKDTANINIIKSSKCGIIFQKFVIGPEFSREESGDQPTTNPELIEHEVLGSSPRKIKQESQRNFVQYMNIFALSPSLRYKDCNG